VARRVEALDLLVAQARVGLANAVLVQQLELLVPALVRELYAGPDHGFLVKDRVDNAGPARTTVYDSLDSGTVNRPQLVLTWG
jgi:hypothetical protein